MGATCNIELAPGTRAEDALTVLAGLMGLRRSQRGGIGPGQWYVAVRDARVQSGGDMLPNCAKLTYVDAEGQRCEQLWHFEYGADGTRGLMPPSSPFWIAAGRRLVDFFGGRVDYNSDDDQETDYAVPFRSDCRADDGEEWERFQQRLWDVQPLEDHEIEWAKPEAAYPDMQ